MNFNVGLVLMRKKNFMKIMGLKDRKLRLIRSKYFALKCFDQRMAFVLLKVLTLTFQGCIFEKQQGRN